MAKTGTKEWAETSINIARGCENGCRYCWARYNLVERFKIIQAEDWTHTKIKQSAVDSHYGNYGGTVMFPTSHDIVPEIINEYCCVLRKLLDAGNQVLIVTKPRIECIRLICAGFAEYKGQILFRFTIGSIYDHILKFWEPNAPSFGERLACLMLAYNLGFKTSVSCEPYLDRTPEETYWACRDYITDSFWIGMLRHWSSRVCLNGVSSKDMDRIVNPLAEALSGEFVIDLYNRLNGRPLIQWKDSVRNIVKCGEQ